MNILVLGSGGREHALAWKLKQSPKCKKLFIAPGNGGTHELGVNISLDPTQFEDVKHFVLQQKIDMVVVGPEDPLVKGIYDYFSDEHELKHVHLIGPSQKGALLEGSKAYAKEFMQENNIPTAAYHEITAENLFEGLEIIQQSTLPIVLKADGLAAGKGVVICQSKEEAGSELKEMLGGKFGEAGNKVIIEEFLDGVEVSVFVFTDGKNYKMLSPAKDYKRIGVGDTGLNTGGMGVVSPVPYAGSAFLEKVKTTIIEPTIKGLQIKNIAYNGIIYFGLMKVEDDPYVIEYNCRFGDPEAQVLIPLIKTDLVDIFTAIGSGKLGRLVIEMENSACATVVLVSGGYPEKYAKGKKVTGIENTRDCIVFHAGTVFDQDKGHLTSGGRVMAITAFGQDLQEALQKCYVNADIIDFEGKYYRKDIGHDVVKMAFNV